MAEPPRMEDIDVPLRRVELPRYRELRERWDSETGLDPEEMSELLGYLLRRVRKRARDVERLVSSAADEDELRTVVADLASRRVEVARLLAEANRTEPALQGEGERIEEGARLELLRRMTQRERGLLAGGGEPDPLYADDREVAVEPVAFAPADEDVPVYVHVPSNVASDAFRQALSQTHFRVSDAGQPAPEGSVIVNWGGRGGLPDEVIVVNPAEAVERATDKLEALRLLVGLAPRTMINPESLPSLGGPFVAKRRRAQPRLPARLYEAVPGDPSELALYDYFQEAIPARRELRITLLNEDVVSAYERRPPGMAGSPGDRELLALDRVPVGAVRTALEARRRIGLDLAGVDLVQDGRTGQWRVLELNSAPGLGPGSLRRLYGLIQQRLRSG